MFWFLSALCGGLTFASVVAHASTIDAHIFGFAATRYSVVLAMAFLTFWEVILNAKKIYFYRWMPDIELMNLLPGLTENRGTLESRMQR